jgi:hypothetical protein
MRRTLRPNNERKRPAELLARGGAGHARRRRHDALLHMPGPRKERQSHPTIEGFGFPMCRLHMLKIKWETRTQPAPMPDPWLFRAYLGRAMALKINR